ncbi:hypothetical protein M3Y94_00778900 [Aphelenchoides besseyi]|nr:hypothetical protein M3Y94_00778900 [Aphelenchoides besseyi]KAI6232338.1 hypothetical protein M3Y95_00475600 [Aphelenchoides besseyi]
MSDLSEKRDVDKLEIDVPEWEHFKESSGLLIQTLGKYEIQKSKEFCIRLHCFEDTVKLQLTNGRPPTISSVETTKAVEVAPFAEVGVECNLIEPTERLSLCSIRFGPLRDGMLSTCIQQSTGLNN